MPDSRLFVPLLLLSGLLLSGCLSQQSGEQPVKEQKPSVEPVPVQTAVESLEFREVVAGDAYSLMLAELNLDEQRDVIKLLNRYVPSRRLRPGMRYAYQLLEDGTLDSLLFHHQPASVLVIRRVGGQLQAYSHALPARSEWFFFSGTLSGNLYESMVTAGVPLEAVISYTDIFQWDVDFFVDCRDGDSWSLLLEKRWLREQNGWRFSLYGPLRYATYGRSDTTLVAWRLGVSGERTGYFTSTGEPFAKTFLKSPLNYRRISSYFSRGRFHPILKKVRPHDGVDFAAAYGTPVVAAGDGRVVKLTYQRNGLGRYIKIRHKNRRYETLYGHLSRYSDGLKVGQQVYQGQVIGFVGTTGMTSGPHLHYTFLIDGKTIDPLRIPNPGRNPLQGGELDQLARVIDLTDSLLTLSSSILPATGAVAANLEVSSD